MSQNPIPENFTAKEIVCDTLTAREIETSRVVLRGNDGAVRARLEIDDENAPRLEMFDGKGASRLCISLAENGRADVALLDGNSSCALLLRVENQSNAGRPQIFLSDAGGAQRLAIGLTDGGEAVISLHDGESKRLALHLLEGRPEIHLADDRGETFAMLREAPSGELEILAFPLNEEIEKGEDA